MKKLILHTLAPAALIVAATSSALALDTFIDTTRQGPTVTPRFQLAYKYKVKKSRSKGAAKFHTSVGQAFLGNQGASFQGNFEVRNDERPTFPFVLFAPVGTGRAEDDTLIAKFDSRKLDPESQPFQLGEFGFAMQKLDDDIGGHSNAQFKKAPVSINGSISVTQLKVKGKIRERKGQWSGAFKYSAKGTISGGENDGKSFSASIKSKLKNAPVQQGQTDQIR